MSWCTCQRQCRPGQYRLDPWRWHRNPNRALTVSKHLRRRGIFTYQLVLFTQSTSGVQESSELSRYGPPISARAYVKPLRLGLNTMPGMNPPPPRKNSLQCFPNNFLLNIFLPPILTLFQVKACDAAALTEAARKLEANTIP